MRPLILLTLAALTASAQDHRIRPSSENPSYWEFGGKLTLLLGGSDDDNLFQWPDDRLRAHLDAMQAVGANYVRNTMSDRPDGGFEVYPFLEIEPGKYDLSKWNPEYWRRFKRLLEWTSERGIVVQIEIWDRFDYTSNRGDGRWRIHPYNPKNNVNYSYKEAGFVEAYPDHPGRNKQPFFFTTPAQRNNRVVLRYQEAFVDKLLSISLDYGNVLYCMDNETSGEAAWGRYWAERVKRRAREKGVEVYVTEMWDDWDLRGEEHRRTLNHPELYDFADVSQNNQQKNGQTHWDNFQWLRNSLKDSPRPLNTVKTYGADGNKFGHADQDGLERFFRHAIGGAASARFHRPPSGLGLSDKAAAAIRAMRRVEGIVPVFDLEPSNERLTERDFNEAYLAADGDDRFIVYFTQGGAAGVKTGPGAYRVVWVDGATGEARESRTVEAKGVLPLEAPEGGHWLAAVVCE